MFVLYVPDKEVSERVKKTIVKELTKKGAHTKVIGKKSEFSKIKNALGAVAIIPMDSINKGNVKANLLHFSKKVPLKTIVLYQETLPTLEEILNQYGVVGVFSYKKIQNDDIEEIGKLSVVVKRVLRRMVYSIYGPLPADKELRKFVVKPIDWKVKVVGGDNLFLLSTSENTFDIYTTIQAFVNDAINVISGKKKKVVSLLITGESGSGKTAIAYKIAKMIVKGAGRDESNPLVKVNISSMPSELVASELFGYEKGAFTGADRDKEGILKVAQRRQVVFLDEVGDIPPSVQVKLLTYMDDGTIQKIGATASENVYNVIIGATNKDIEREIANGNLRRDFIYRWQYRISLPSLSERGRDIRTVISFLLQQLDINPTLDTDKKIEHISVEVIEYLESLKYDGNFRQLMSLLRMAVARASMEGSSVIMLRHIIGR